MKQKSKKNKTRKKNKSNRNGNGGKVIASGGFGCVFRPVLKCKTQKNQNDQREYITKLMTKKHATSEYDEIIKFQKILNHIPNYTKYFLVDGFTICEPDTLTREDLKNYKEKCRALQKDNIYEDNINNSLHKVLALNMPDGGKDVGDYIDENRSENKLIGLNNSLIELLLKGIIPMNKSHIYHCDIKESNVLVKEDNKTLYTRLIDWGLSCEYNSHQLIPKQLTRRPFQYNVPYSIILFNKEFITRYTKFLKKNPNINYATIREFVINYILIWINIRGAGHLKVINSQMNKLFINQLPVLDDDNKLSFIEYEFTYHYIIEYISKILQKYTKKNKMYLKEYFNDVFIKNIDIWGFVMIYMPFISFLYDKYNDLNKYEKKLFNKLKYIIVHFLFENPCDPIDMNELSKELKTINNLFQESDGITSVTEYAYETDASLIKSKSYI
jgi:serine/threonine protein kinase